MVEPANRVIEQGSIEPIHEIANDAADRSTLCERLQQRAIDFMLERHLRVGRAKMDLRLT